MEATDGSAAAGIDPPVVERSRPPLRDPGHSQRWGSDASEGSADVVRQDERAPFREALERAREAAWPAGEHVGQEGFMRADEIRRLARRAGIGPGVPTLDLCCGVGGPGRLLTAELGCRYLGVDCSASAVAIARELAGDLPCRFEQAHVPPLPAGRFEVVLLLETMLAFADKRALIEEVARVLEPGGRFAFTAEVGSPLTPAERARMPDADTVWLIDAAELGTLLHELGCTVTWQEECSAPHQAMATALLRSFRADSAAIARQVGRRALTELIAAHELWSHWLGGRVRKVAVVAEKR
jgi:SAM-dependent methyltransferase